MGNTTPSTPRRGFKHPLVAAQPFVGDHDRPFDTPFSPRRNFNFKRALMNSAQPFYLIGAEATTRYNEALRRQEARLQTRAVVHEDLPPGVTAAASLPEK